MHFDLNAWIGQVTTGHGAMILGPTLVAAISGTITWRTAIPFLAAGIIGLLWPENAPMQVAATNTTTDVEALIAAYRTGLSHGATTETTPTGTVAGPSHPGVGASVALATLAATGLALGACTSQSPAEQVAAAATVANGLLCIADASGNVVATATTSDPNALKAVNAAVAAGDVLLTDAACQRALANTAAAVPPLIAGKQ